MDFTWIMIDDAWIIRGLCMDYAPIMRGCCIHMRGLCMDCAWMLYGLCVDYAWIRNGLGNSIRGLCMVHSVDDARIMHGISYTMHQLWRNCAWPKWSMDG